MFNNFCQWWKQRQQRAIEKTRVSVEQWERVEENLGLLDHLDANDRLRLRKLALRFLAEKEMHGAQGLELNADIQLNIALQACLLILNLDLGWYRGWVGIIVYPGDFIIPRRIEDEHGVVHEFDDAVLGEAWEGGPVLLSWLENYSKNNRIDDFTGDDGINVVIHEFAHKLDMLNGAADGLPPLHPGMSRHDWVAAFEPAYANFCDRVDHGENTALDSYAAEHPAEFFAVMSEAFFETPQLLRFEYPSVYTQLQQFYRQDPASKKNSE